MRSRGVAGNNMRARRGVASSAVVMLATLASSVTGQLWEDVFICSPTAFTMTLNFTGACPGTIEEGAGIDGTECFFVPNATLNMSPVSVERISIQELGRDLKVLDNTNEQGEFVDGDSIEYTSVSSGEITELEQVPGGLQVNLIGRNALSQEISNSFLIQYTNDGSASPVIVIGDQIGWVTFTDLAPARPEYCPAVTLAPTTEAPVTMAPGTSAPVSSAPVTVTMAPVTGAPVVAPSSDAPVTVAPVVAPSSDAPVTIAPVSGAPVVAPTDMPASPVAPPTDSPVAPMAAPTPSPVRPTFKPVAPIAPISPAPIMIETPYPTFMSMSMEIPPMKGGKKGKSDKERSDKKDKEMSPPKGEKPARKGGKKSSSSDESYDGSEKKGGKDKKPKVVKVSASEKGMETKGGKKGSKEDDGSYFGRRRRRTL